MLHALRSAWVFLAFPSLALSQSVNLPDEYWRFNAAVTEPTEMELGEYSDVVSAYNALLGATTGSAFLTFAGAESNIAEGYITINYEATPRTETVSVQNIRYRSSQYANCSNADDWQSEQALIDCFETLPGAFGNSCFVETAASGPWQPRAGNTSLIRGYAVTIAYPDQEGNCPAPTVSDPAYFIIAFPEASCSPGYTIVEWDLDALTLTCENTTKGEIVFLDNREDVEICIGNPCTIAGGKIQNVVDYQGPFLQLTRSYRSNTNVATTTGGILGRGWTHNFGSHLMIMSGVPTAYLDRSGTFERLILLEPGVYVGRNGRSYQVRPDALGWVVYLGDGSREVYSGEGTLLAIIATNGQQTTVSYASSADETNRIPEAVTSFFGHQIVFEYRTISGGQRVLSGIVDPASERMGYDVSDSGSLESVTYQDLASVQYTYVPNEIYGSLLHEVIDEAGNTFATFEYDEIGRAILTEHSGGTERYTLDYEADGSVRVRNAAGFSSIYRFRSNSERGRLIGSVVGATAWSSTFESDGRRRRTGFTDAGSVTTGFGYDQYHQTSKSVAVGTADERTTTYEYLEDTSDLPTRIVSASILPGEERSTEVAYASGTRLPEVITMAGFTLAGQPVQRATTYEYNGIGQVIALDGPRTDVVDRTTYSYYDCITGSLCGQLSSETNALGHTTTYHAYDAHGRLLESTDPNDVMTTFEYDLRGRLKSVSVESGPETRRIEYDFYADGLVSDLRFPGGQAIHYDYDAAKQLTALTDNAGNVIEYTYDTRGNRTGEYIRDSAGTLARQSERAFSFRDKVSRVSTPDTSISISQDSRGRVSGVQNLSIGFNSRDNLTRVDYFDSSSESIAASFTYNYDDIGRILSADTPNGAVTLFEIDDLGNLLLEDSPDSGVTVMEYDAAGNETRSIDARGVERTMTYDALNRAITREYTDAAYDESYVYDLGPLGIGHLSQMTDQTGTSSFQYNGFGEVVQVSRSVNVEGSAGPVSYATNYEYSSGGLVERIVYPSGREVTYGLDEQGRVASISTLYNGQASTIISSVQYQPFGPVAQIVYGNGLTQDWEYDLQYRPQMQTIGTIHSLGYSYDNIGNMSRIDDNIDPARSQIFTYGFTGDLETEQGIYGAKTYSSDFNANRVNRTFDDGTTLKVQTLVYEANSNRIATRNNNAVVHDEVGNITLPGNDRFSYVYGASNRLAETWKDGALQEVNKYAGTGERLIRDVIDTEGIVSRLFEYLDVGLMLHELKIAKNGNRIERDIVWLNGAPIAQFRNRYRADGTFRDEQPLYLHGDHLKTPRIGTNESGTIVWRWDSDAFGKGGPNTDPDGDGSKHVVKLRLPGQYADGSSGKRYNYYRDYHPGMGRFLQADPSGIVAGPNPYAYVAGNPVTFSDSSGMCFSPVCREIQHAWDGFDARRSLREYGEYWKGFASYFQGMLKLGRFLDRQHGFLGECEAKLAEAEAALLSALAAAANNATEAQKAQAKDRIWQAAIDNGTRVTGRVIGNAATMIRLFGGIRGLTTTGATGSRVTTYTINGLSLGGSLATSAMAQGLAGMGDIRSAMEIAIKSNITDITFENLLETALTGELPDKLKDLDFDPDTDLDEACDCDRDD